MKKIYLITTLTILLFINFVSASEIGLIENQTWQNNLISSTTLNGAVFGDIDGDDDLDMISLGCTVTINSCGTSNADKTYVWINNGTSFVENSTWEQNLTNSSGSMSLGDIDNDGDLDLVISLIGEPAGGTKIYINNGTTLMENSTWQSVLMNPLFLDESGSVALGDIDNDGDLDLLLPGSTHIVYINNGTSFVNNSIWDQEITDENRISTGLADFDNDGDLDLNIAGINSGKTYENNGTSFVANSNWNTGGGDEASMAWGDIDNDGDFDNIVSGFTTKVSINEINTTGFFGVNSSWATFGAYSFGSNMLGDYDNNGFLDLVLLGLGLQPRIQIANNSGSFFEIDSTAQANLTGAAHSSALWGDIDNDGDLDLVVIRTLKVYISNASLTNPNEVPTPSTSFSSSYNNRQISLGWLNGSDNETPSTGLYYNLMVGTGSNNHSIISGIYGGQGDANRGGTAFGYFGNMMQRKNFTLNVDRLQPSTTYNWYVQTIDTGLKAGNWSGIQSFTTSADLNRPIVTLNSPVDNANFSSYSITFNTTVSDNLNLSNVTLWGNWTGTFQINETNSSGLNATNYIFTKDLTAFGDGVYSWQIQAEDNETNVQNSSIRTFTIDTTPPYFTSIENQSVLVNKSFSYDINATDDGVGLDSFSIDDTTNFSINSSTGVVTNATILIVNYYLLNVTINDTLGISNWSLWSVNVTPDTTSPNVTINSPSGTLSTNNATINISFVDNLALDYCSYNITNSSGGSVIANNEIACLVNSVEYQTVSDGSNYTLTVFANDTSGNINTINQTFSVDVPTPSPSGGGGGGGSSTPAPVLEEFDIDFSNVTSGSIEAKQGEIKTFSFNGQITHKITLIEVTTNSVKLIIESEPITLVLDVGETKQVDVNRDDINDLEIKLVSIISGKANILLEKLEGADIVAKEELEKEPLFDVKVSISDKYKRVFAGEEVTAEIEVFNVNNIGQVDVIVNYYLSDNKNTTILTQASDTLAVEAVTSFVRTLTVPENTEPGTYLFNVNVTYKDFVTSSNAEFKVKSREINFIQERFKEIIIIAVVLIAIVLFIYLRIIKKKEEKIWKKEARLEREVKDLLKGKKRKKWQK